MRAEVLKDLNNLSVELVCQGLWLHPLLRRLNLYWCTVLVGAAYKD